MRLDGLAMASSSRVLCVCVYTSVSIDCTEWAWVMCTSFSLSYTCLASNRVEAHRGRKEQSGCMSFTILPSSDSEGSGVNRDHRMQLWKWFKRNLKVDINVTSAIHDLLKQKLHLTSWNSSEAIVYESGGSIFIPQGEQSDCHHLHS